MTPAIAESTSSTALTRASSDDQLIGMWLHERPDNTVDSYQRDIAQFRDFLANKPLGIIVLEDIQNYITHLRERGLKDSSVKRKVNSIKSLFSFATDLGYTRFNVALVVKPPKTPVILAQRIMTPMETMRLTNQKTGARKSDRNRIFLTFLYAVGARISEACALTWRNFQRQPNGQMQVAIVGKGQKVRLIVVPLPVWQEVESLREDAGIDDLVFGIGRKMGHLIMKQAVEAAKLDPQVSCHWLRHAHGQHALANGAPLQLVRDTMGHANISTTNWYLESMPGDSSSKYLGF